MAAKLKVFWKHLRSNLAYLISAFIIALVLWSYILVEINPERSKSYGGVDVVVSGLASLEKNGLMLSAAVNQDVTVHMNVRRNDLRFVTGDSIRVTADLSQIQSPGTHSIPLIGQCNNGTIVNISPESIEVVVEDLVTRTVPINFAADDAVPDDRYVLRRELSTPSITITGPAKVLEIASGRVHVNYASDIGSFSQTLPVELMDAAGMPITFDHTLRLSSSEVTANLTVLPVEALRVNIDAAYEGTPARGYQMMEMGVADAAGNPAATLRVAGPPEALAMLREGGITTAPVDITGATRDVNRAFEPLLPEGCLLVDEADIVAHITPVIVSKEFTDIEVVGTLGQSQTTKLGVFVKITATGPQLLIESINRNELLAYVDISNFVSGEYDLKVDAVWLSTDTAVRVEVMLAVEPYHVTVTLP